MAQGEYTISEARQGRTYDSKYGDMVVWYVKLNNATADTPTGEFELHKKPGNTPKAGDSIEVDRFHQGEFDGNPFVRIYAAKQNTGSGGGSSGGGGKGGYSQADIARITRSHSQEMAVRLITATGAAQGLDPSNATDAGPFLNGVVRRLADWFDADVQAAEARVTAPQQVLGEEVPADRMGLNGSPDPDESIPF